MRRRIVLRGEKDRDLVLLYKNVGPTRFSRITKDALRVLIRGNWTARAELPEGLLDTSIPTEDVEFYLCITSENDTDIIDLLNHIRNRKTTEFIRLAIRYYVGAAVILHTFLEEEYGQSINEKNMPKQVFAIGGTASSITKVKKEKTKPRKNRHSKIAPKKENLIPTISTPAFQTETIPSFSVEKVEETIPKTPEMDADEMLALLEGLL